MKKIFLGLIILLTCICVSCTDNVRSRVYGGNSTVHVKQGYKLVEVTWKNNDMWYLIEPMEDDYIPKTKIFQENSNYGIINGSVTFIESR